MPSSRLVIITDLDGTLLDHSTYGCENSLPAVERLKALGIPLVLCSSKTASEMVELWRRLGLRDPFVSENGGAVYVPRGYFSFPLSGTKERDSWDVLELGADIASLRRALSEAARRSGVEVRTFGEMNPDEVARLTGLAPEQAALALRREYDEPFVLERGSPKPLTAELEAAGFSVTWGGRLFHLGRGNDKGKAVKHLLELYRRADPGIRSVGLGNSTNDLPLLRQVDRPILVRNEDGSYDDLVLKALPGIERTREIGPRGWSEAVARLLASEQNSGLPTEE